MDRKDNVLDFSLLESILDSFSKEKKQRNPNWTRGTWAKALGLSNTAGLARSGEPTPGDRFVKGVFSADIRHTIPLPSVTITAGQIKGTYFEVPAMTFLRKVDA